MSYMEKYLIRIKDPKSSDVLLDSMVKSWLTVG